MYVEVYGQGEPLLLIHGNGNSIRNNSPIIYDFQKNTRL